MENTTIHAILNTFCLDLCNKDTPWNISDEALALSSSVFAKALKDQYGKEDENTFHVSALGHPGIDQLSQVFPCTPNRFSPTQRQTFLRGNIFEAKVIALLYDYYPSLGIEFNPELVTNVNGNIYSYHPDFILQLGKSSKAIIECKSVSSYYLTQFLTKQDKNDRGYLSQLALYLYFTGIEEGYFLMENVDGQQYRVCLLKFSLTELYHYLEEALDTLLKLQKVNNLDDFVNTFDVPTPKANIINKGNYAFPAVPESLRWSRYLNCFYELEEEKGSTVPRVQRIKNKEEIKECLKNYILQ